MNISKLWIGYFDPIVAFKFLKLNMVFGFLWVSWFFYLTCQRLLSEKIALLALAFCCLWPWGIEFSTHTLSENYALWVLAPAFYLLSDINNEQNNFRKWFLIGLLIGMSGWFRILSLAYITGPFIYLIFQKQKQKNFKNILRLMLGFSIAILIYFIVDWQFKGNLFQTLISYYDINVIQGMISEEHDPWYDFLKIYNIQFGEWFFPLFLILMIWAGYHFLPIYLWMVGIVFIFHSFMPQKEIRWLSPSLFPMWIMFWVGLQKLNHKKLWVYSLGAMSLVLVLRMKTVMWSGGASGEVFTKIQEIKNKEPFDFLIQFEPGAFTDYFTLNQDIPIYKGYHHANELNPILDKITHQQSGWLIGNKIFQNDFSKFLQEKNFKYESIDCGQFICSMRIYKN